MVPIVVDGTLAVYRGWRVSPWPGLIRIRVLDAVTAAEVGGSAEQLRDLVWARMSQALREMRGHAGESAPAAQGTVLEAHS